MSKVTRENRLESLIILLVEDVCDMRHVDLVLTDLAMPNMDGNSLIHEIRSSHVYEDLPVTVFTALSNPQSVQDAWDVGCDSFVTKPFTMSDLKKGIAGGNGAAGSFLDRAGHSRNRSDSRS